MTDEVPQPGTTRATDDESHGTIGIALSGGGSRAALYSLGVLLYLVHSNLNEQVRLISSVSGGSIVNAALSLSKDYSRLSSREFERIASTLANRLAHRGVFFFMGWRRLLGAVVVLIFILILVVSTAFSATSMPPFFRMENRDSSRTLIYSVLHWIGVLEPWIFTFYGALFLTLLLSRTWFNRGKVQMSVYASLMAEFQQKREGHRSKDQLKLSEVNPETRVRHVLCATELTSGRPIYMDRREIRSPAYGSGKPNLSLAKAIYASAAFPVGFPPLRVKTASLNMNGGDMEERPKWLLLSDGGVFNNLGTDSFTAWTTSDPFMADPRFVEWPWPSITQRIVVNASSPGRLASVPRLWGWRYVVTMQRIMAVLYENTLRPRIQALLAEEEEPDGPMIIDIANSPIAILERQMGIERWKDSGEYKRAHDTLEKLKGFQNAAYWHEYSVRASSTKTVLRAIGQTAAVRLLRLGYLDATISCHVRLNSAGLESVPSEAWFQELVKDQDDSRERLEIRPRGRVQRKEPAQAKVALRRSGEKNSNDPPQADG